MSGIEIRRLAPDVVDPAVVLLRRVAEDPHGRFFTPHPFTRDGIAALAAAPGQDLYYLLLDAGGAVAYGLLRGWNAGYAIPSLGLAVAPDARGMGYGSLMTSFLHVAARRQGAVRVRLRVHHENTQAIRLYAARGYVFPEPPDRMTGLQVGFCDVAKS
jgi:ribosomal protein S18 acetylase RimI-like enzyme